jgi:hypothetical protein
MTPDQYLRTPSSIAKAAINTTLGPMPASRSSSEMLGYAWIVTKSKWSDNTAAPNKIPRKTRIAVPALP